MWAIFFAYVIYAMTRLNFTWDRFVVGIHNGAQFLSRMFPPQVMQPESMFKGLQESLEIAVLASFFGVILSLPLGAL